MAYERAAYQKNKADAMFLMAFHSEAVGKVEDAVKAYQKIIDICPDHYQSHIQLSRIFQRKGMEDQASFHRQRAEAGRTAAPVVERKGSGIRRIEASPYPGPVRRTLDAPAQEVHDPEGDLLIKGLLPHTWSVFYSRFDSLREVQRKTVPIILKGQPALVSSSTASGKTEAIFAPLVERLINEGWTGLSIIYVSPTRALVGDIKKRLEGLLAPLGIRVAARSGDVKDFDDSSPQEVLVTTPESLDSFMSWRPQSLAGVRAVVLDELHMLDGSYRGDQLRVLLRRLELEHSLRPSVYAASATVSNPEEVAGRYMRKGRVVRSPAGRGIDYAIVPTLEQAIRTYREKGGRKTLVFCNTPQEAEETAAALGKLFPPYVIRVHHGQLQSSKRLEAERALKFDDEVVCACTSTLEVGIDIGDIDMVILAHRPRSISSVAQRIGRSNRRKTRMSAVAVARSVGESAYYEMVFNSILRSKFDVEDYCFDPSVAVQQVLSVLQRSAGKDGAFFVSLLGGLLEESEVLEILENLAKNGWIEKEGELWRATSRTTELGPKVHSNIPGYESIRVIDADTEEPIGSVSLPIDNIFVLGGQAWLVKDRTATTVLVKKVETNADVATFASYDRFGAFFDHLPSSLRIKVRQRQNARAR